MNFNSVSPAYSASKVNTGPQNSSERDEIDLVSLFNTLWRGKWLIALISALVVIAGGYYAFIHSTPLYRATAVIILEPAKQSVTGLESMIGGTGLSGDTNEVNSEVQVLRSRSLVGKVVDDLGLITDPEFNGSLRPDGWADYTIDFVKGVLRIQEDPPISAERKTKRERDATVKALLDRLFVSNVSRSYVFNLTVETENAMKSARIADAFSEIYIEDQLQVKFDQTERATVWLTEKVSELKVELEDAETEMSVFSNSTDLISPEVLKLQEIQLKELRERVVEAGIERSAARERLNNARGNGDELRLARAQAEFDRLRLQEATLQASREDLEAQIERQNGDLIKLQQFRREVEAKGLLYEHFLTRLNEATAQQGIQQPDSRILSKAVEPLFASSPRKMNILAMSALLGLLLGVAIVIWRDTRRTGFVTADDLESASGYPVLGQVPVVPGRHRKAILNYLAMKPASAHAESYRNLRTSLMLTNIDTPPQVIMSTSCVPGEGKTTNSLALAQNLTGLGKKVILIEGDIRKRTFGEYFENLPKKGLVSVITGTTPLEDALYHDDRLQAAILPGDKSKANAADIFASEKFKKLIKELRKSYDIVLIDTPPVLVVPDARIIAEVADAVLFTVKWDDTSRVQVEDALRTFHNSGQSLTGFVLSQINPRKMRRYGGKYRYSTYGDDGQGYYEG